MSQVLLLAALLFPLPAVIQTAGILRAGEATPVAAARVVRGVLSHDVAFAAELRPFQEVDLHAKVTGYVEQIAVDIGDRVQAGQLVAALEVPELKDEIQRTQALIRRSEEDVKRTEAELQRAKATYEEAHVTYSRLAAAEKAQPNLIARQDIDVAKARNDAAAAQVATAAATLASAQQQVAVQQAELKKLHTTVGFSRITAPFDGIITRRSAHPGALIQAGASSGASPLVRLSQNDKLRVVFPVSLSFVTRVQVGDPVEVRVASLGRTFTGRVARLTRRVETATRTMEAEVDLPNPDLALIPGLYATVLLKLGTGQAVMIAPVEAVARDKGGATVYAIRQDNRIEERTVSLGQETATHLEILGGLNENDLVMIGSRANLKPGQRVEPKLVAPTPAK